MNVLSNILTGVFLIGGCFFFFVGTLGLIRMPDVFCRMHASSKCDTFGTGLILFALAIHSGANIYTLKLILIIIFLWITNPTASHIIAKVEFHAQKITRSSYAKKRCEK